MAFFTRSRFKLDEDSVSFLLPSCLGGSAFRFNIRHLLGRSFKFSVASKFVGLFIYSTKSFSHQNFEVRFSLWGNGGPIWERELLLWEQELEKEWITVHRTK